MMRKQNILIAVTILILIFSIVMLFLFYFSHHSPEDSAPTDPIVCHYYTNGKVIYSLLPQKINCETAGTSENIFASIICTKDNGNGSYTYQTEISESNVLYQYPEFDYDGTEIITAARGRNVTIKIYPPDKAAELINK